MGPVTSGVGVKTPTLPFYSDSFTFGGKTYPYTSLGTDPRTSSAATHIPVIFIPIRVFVTTGSNWPTGAIKLTTGSALFHNAVCAEAPADVADTLARTQRPARWEVCPRQRRGRWAWRSQSPRLRAQCAQGTRPSVSGFEPRNPAT